jgi:S-adenosylmethionine hydrolase
MKGVILDIVPEARLIDISHEVPPHNVRQAAYLLYSTYRYFPPGTVHLVVVDPGVGGRRRPMAVRAPSGYFVGPDNGTFSYVMACQSVEEVVELCNPRYRLPHVSHTFHGRDVFAPAAAYLAAGVPVAAMGAPMPDPVTLPQPRLELAEDGIVGEVMHVDRFGNVTTTIGQLEWSGDELLLEPVAWAVRPDRRQAGEHHRDGAPRPPGPFKAAEAAVLAGGHQIVGLRRTYADVRAGEVLVLVGSIGHLEIAVREGSAGQRLGLRLGDPVQVRL